MLLLMLSPKLLNFTRYLTVLKSLQWLKINQRIQYNIIHTQNTSFWSSFLSSVTLTSPALSVNSFIFSRPLGRPFNQSRLKITCRSIYHIPLLLYGTHFLLIFIRFLTIILWPHLPLLHLLLFLFLLKTPLIIWTDISGTAWPGYGFNSLHFYFFLILSVFWNKEASMCSTFTGTYSQLHLILLFILTSSHIIS